MRPSDAYLLPLTTLATLLTVVACGPTKDYVPVSVKPGTPLSQALQKCSEEIRPSKAKVITSSTTMCEVGRDGLYARVAHTFRYDVQSQGSTLRLSVKPALEYSTDVTKQTDTAVKDVIGEVCQERIAGVFQRSVSRSSARLAFEIKIDDEATADSPLLDLRAVEGGAEPAFVIKTWPDRAQLYPFGLKKDTDRCAKLPTDIEKSRCRWAAIEAANEPFCAQLAVLAGHWLGLKSPKDPKCKDAPAATEQNREVGAAKPRPEPESAYMKGAYEMEPKDFFAKASLSRADLKAVFAPACTSVRSLPDEASLKRR